jgi:hypothetical protein
MTTTEYLSLHPCACAEGAAFARQYQTMAEVWDACERPDWLLWVAERLPETPQRDRALRRIACRAVRETPGVWDLLTDARSRRAVEVAEAYVEGKASAEDLRAAADAAWAATRAAEAAYAAWAARAAAYAATRAAAATAVACAAAYAAADAAADAAAAAAYAAARKVQAAIVRAEIPNPFRS